MGTPFKMKAGKEGPMKKNFGISPMKQDKMKASQTKTNVKTGVTTVDPNPGSKSETESLVHKRPKNPDGTPYTDKQMNELRKESFVGDIGNMPVTSKGSFSNAKTTKF
jgi:hypothetical protein